MFFLLYLVWLVALATIYIVYFMLVGIAFVVVAVVERLFGIKFTNKPDWSFTGSPTWPWNRDSPRPDYTSTLPDMRSRL